MRVWLYDTCSDRAVEADLVAMEDAHVERAGATWVPEFHRRRRLCERDEDCLVWDWPSKYHFLLAQCEHRRGYVVTCGGDLQGMLTLQEDTETSRLVRNKQVLYVRYLAAAPWNRRYAARVGRYRRTGTVLLARSVSESLAAGCEGRIGLHSLSSSNAFYRKLGFCDLGPDP